MRLLLCLLAGLYASSAWGQEFGCGFGLGPEGVSGASGTSSHNVAYYQSGTIKPLILFGTFKGVAGKTLTKLQNRELFENPIRMGRGQVSRHRVLAHRRSQLSGRPTPPAACPCRRPHRRRFSPSQRRFPTRIRRSPFSGGLGFRPMPRRQTANPRRLKAQTQEPTGRCREL